MLHAICLPAKKKIGICKRRACRFPHHSVSSFWMQNEERKRNFCRKTTRKKIQRKKESILCVAAVCKHQKWLHCVYMLRFSQRCVSQLDRKQMKRNIVRNRIAMPKSTKERKKKKWMQRRAEAITTNEFYINYHNYLIKIWRRQSKSHLIMKQLIIKQQNCGRDGRKPRVKYTGWWFRRTIKAGLSHARRLHLM